MRLAARALSLGCLLALLPGLARAAEGKSGYHLFNPVPRAEMRELNTDRPDKTESPYTVDAGHLQIETDLITYTRDKEAGAENETASIFLLNIKAGLTPSIDLQLILSPQEKQSSAAGTVKTKASGFGDTSLRLKVNVLGNDEGPIAIAFMPFVKFATAARDLERDHNQKVEGGLIVPFALSLPGKTDLGMMLQLNHAADENGTGRHAEVISTATVSHDLVGELAGYAEFYSESSGEQGAEWVATADTGLTYGLTPDLQLDAGANIGLTESADDLNLFAGISARF